MLCAKYDYKMDIAVKKEEAFQDGMEAKAIEAAENFLKMNIATPEQIAEGTGLPLDKVLELKEKVAIHA